jgi:type I restriction enzyme, R subunit
MENQCRRQKQKRADYLLRYRRDFMIGVIEAKSAFRSAADGVQQAKDYALTLGLKFAYSTNGKKIIEYSFLTGKEVEIEKFPPPDELMSRLRFSEGIKDDLFAERLVTPGLKIMGKQPRYYQEIAINRVIKAVLSGQKRILLTMATGTGKTFVAFQIVWKLWNSRWNKTGEYRKPKILYLADRSVLVDDPKDKMFAPLGDARHKIQGEAVKSREVYFATYQAIAEDERRPGLFRDYPRDFFDLIIVDECHRGSAKDENNWRVVSSHYFLFNINTNLLLQKYLAYVLKTDTFFSQIKAQGSTNYAAIRPKDVLKIKIPYCNIDLQRNIVDKLDSITAKNIHFANNILKEKEYMSNLIEAILSN